MNKVDDAIFAEIDRQYDNSDWDGTDEMINGLDIAAIRQVAFNLFTEKLLSLEDTLIPIECINMDDPEGLRGFRGLVRAFAKKETS